MHSPSESDVLLDCTESDASNSTFRLLSEDITFCSFPSYRAQARAFQRRTASAARSRTLCRLRNIFLFVAFTLVFTSVPNGVFRPSYQNPPQHYKELTTRAHSSSRPGRGNIAKEKVFIAANIIDGGLIRGQWGTSLLSLIDLLGEDNTFVSIYENDSGEATSAALRELQLSMKCKQEARPLDILPAELSRQFFCCDW